MWSVDSYQIIKILVTRCKNFKVKILKIQIQSNCCVYWLKYRSVDSQEINKILATRCHILRLKFTKFKIGWGSAPAYSAHPGPLAGYKGTYF